MAEYIDRDTLIKKLQKFASDYYSAVINNIIIGMPKMDVAPVVHGRWKLLRKGDWNSVFICSVCGRRETITESETYNSQLKMPKKYPYCHCGARMDEQNEPEN